MKALDEVTAECVALFETEGISYALMGGLAVRVYALPRATYDVDFTISLPRAELPRLNERLKKLGYSSRPPRNRAG